MATPLRLNLQKISSKYAVRIPWSCRSSRFADIITYRVNGFTECDDARIYESGRLEDDGGLTEILYLEFSSTMRGEIYILCAILRIIDKVMKDNDLKQDPPDKPDKRSKTQWLDHSIRPIPGMIVEAYFGGELQRKKVTSWFGDVCFFDDNSKLHWSKELGFTYR